MVECKGGAVIPIKCRRSLTTQPPGRLEAPVIIISSTPAVVQVVPEKNSYYRKDTSKIKPRQEGKLDSKPGRMKPISLVRQMYLGKKTDKPGVDGTS